MIVTTTQIYPKSIWVIIPLILHIMRVRKQLKTARGLLKLDFASGWTTLSAWESMDDLKAFRNAGAHLAAMRATRRIGTARTVTWEAERLPTWEEVRERLGSPEAARSARPPR